MILTSGRYWGAVLSFSAIFNFLPVFVLALFVNIAVILGTARVSCLEGQCVQGFS